MNQSEKKKTAKKRRPSWFSKPRIRPPKKVQRLYFDGKGAFIGRRRERQIDISGLDKKTRVVSAGKFSAEQLKDFKNTREWHKPLQ